MHVCGISHARAPLETLERYALSPDAARAMLGRVRSEAAASQAMVLSTCNRTELYAWSDAPDCAARLRALMLAIGAQAAPDAAPDAAPPPLYEHRGLEAIRHLFAVESGLNSMILGENHIKRQAREAWEASQAAGTAGPDLNRAMQAALACGKRIRSETALNVGTLELDIAAILKAEQELGSLEGRVCLVIGAGKIGRRAARALAERRPARLLIVNRTPSKARAIAEACGGEAHGLDALPGLLPLADFVLGATYAPEYVVRLDALAQAPARDGARVACLIDVAMPRVIDPRLAELPGVRLFDLEHMQEAVEANRRKRLDAARVAWDLVEEEIEKYRRAAAQAALAPAIARLRERFDHAVEQERPELDALMAGLDEPARRKLKALHRRLKQRLLHEAIVELKERLAGEEG
jgi:glutamyl-tRNA reductase